MTTAKLNKFRATAHTLCAAVDATPIDWGAILKLILALLAMFGGGGGIAPGSPADEIL